jgi:hypothetical protein
MSTGFYGTTEQAIVDLLELVERAELAATNAETAESNAELSEINAGTSETNAGVSESNAATSEANAGASETATATSENNAATSAANALNSQNYSEEWANKAEDSLVSVAAGGNGVDEYSAKHWAKKAEASGGGTAWVYQDVTSNVTLAASAMAGVDTDTLAITVTLPATPTQDDEIWIKDSTGNSATNNITVARNGSTIEGLAEDLTISTAYDKVFLKYSSSTWKVMS